MTKGNLLIVAILLALLGVALWMMVAGWNRGAGVEMSGQAIGAMVIGILFSLVVGCGLMFLVFFSSRRGYDEQGRLMRKDEE